MGCNQTLSGLVKDCTPSQGGVSAVALGLRDDLASVEIENGQVSAITLREGGAKAKRFEFGKNTASMTSTKTIDRPNGVQFVTTDLVMKFTRMETTKRTEAEAMCFSDLFGLVRDNNGKWWLLGKDEELNASAADGQTGTARTDSNAYNITLQDVSREFPYEVPEAIALSVIE